MKRLLSTTTALSLALAPIQPWPLFAQTIAEDGSVIAEDGTVLCMPTAEAPCDLDAIMAAIAAEAEAKAKAAEDPAAAAEAAAKAEAEAAAQKAVDDAAAAEAAAQAEAEAAAQKAVEDAAAAEAAAQAEAEAATQAEADAAAQKAVEDAAAAEAAAAAQAEADAAAKVEADAAAQAEADAAAQAEADAAAQAEADAAALKAADDAAAAEAAAQADADVAAQTAAEDAAAAEAAAAEDALAAEKAAAEAAAATAAAEAEAVQLTEDEHAAAQKAAEEAATAQAAAEAEAEVAAAAAEEAAKAAAEALASGTAEEAAAAEEVARSAEGDAVEATAKAAEEAAILQTLVAETAPVEPVEALVPQDTAVEALTDLLGAPTADTGTLETLPTIAAAETLLAPTDADPAADPEKAPIDVLTTLIEAQDTRSSVEEFAAPPVTLRSGKKSGLSDLEKVGLIALGALVVGAILSNGREVVSNSGDRVVVRDADGNYIVYKDDDTLLRRPGSTVRTETYRDGSTRTIVDRDDGTQVVTIRDASGRVIRRASYDRDGNEFMLIDDFVPEERIVITDLPRPRRDPVTISTRDGDAALKAALAVEDAERIGRKFSLRQIRDIPQVRALAATIDAERITFDSGSSVIRATEARKLADLGRTMADLIDDNPRELFLIEGHTDAVGSAASNLALSDRRAESVALALAEYFDIPPENMVVQGYGEAELLIDTDADERLNRRVGVRLISPLMRTASR